MLASVRRQATINADMSKNMTHRRETFLAVQNRSELIAQAPHNSCLLSFLSPPRTAVENEAGQARSSDIHMFSRKAESIVHSSLLKPYNSYLTCGITEIIYIYIKRMFSLREISTRRGTSGDGSDGKYFYIHKMCWQVAGRYC